VTDGRSRQELMRLAAAAQAGKLALNDIQALLLSTRVNFGEL